MIRVYTLGTGASLSDAHRSTTMLAVDNGKDLVAVDCGGDIYQRMLLVGLSDRPLEALILTHHHPDHLCGFPLLVQKLWLSGLQEHLLVLGPRDTLDAAKRVLEVFAPDHWRDRIQIEWSAIEPGSDAPIEIGSSWALRAGWVDHVQPAIGLRLTDRESKKVVAYSGDTAPCDAVIALSKDADLLIHEATGGFEGHSTAEDAARIAREAGARRLALVHAPPDGPDRARDLDAARHLIPTAEYAVECGLYSI